MNLYTSPSPLTWITIFKALYISRLLIYQTAPIHIIWWSIEYNKPQTRVHHYQMGRQAKTITHRPFNIRQPIDQWIKRRRLLDHNWSAAAKAAVVGYVIYSLKIWFYIESSNVSHIRHKIIKINYWDIGGYFSAGA